MRETHRTDRKGNAQNNAGSDILRPFARKKEK